MSLLVQASPSTRVLAIGAHPDDLEYGAGGFLARLARQGAQVTALVASVPTLVEERTREAQAGAAALGVTLRILGGGRLEDRPNYAVVAQLDAIVTELRPDLVITHGDQDAHFDHGMVHRATISALRRWPCSLLAYATNPAAKLGTLFADITETIEQKLEAIRAHRTQLGDKATESARELARAMGRLSGYEFAECYEVLRARV